MDTSPYVTQSASTKTNYHLSVSAPKTEHPEKPFLVLVMDGDDQFTFAKEARDSLQADGLVNPLLLVGVGYGASYAKSANRRMRDYTPTEMTGESGTGGASDFLKFLKNELIPWIGDRYAFREDGIGIIGHSLGSLFGLYAFIQSPALFSRCLASAPSLWYNDRALLRHEADFAAQNPSLPGRLFLSVGTEDSPSMTGDLALFEQQLANHSYRDLALTSERFPGRNHYDVLYDAFRAGFQALYGARR
ncbi:MAG TPA: alpha/beta hydrolase-fold protein [Opitutaceae bacterium]|nr:alpha/beta hydrolase-fold protein [Opitutaceae bacterium]